MNYPKSKVDEHIEAIINNQEEEQNHNANMRSSKKKGYLNKLNIPMMIDKNESEIEEIKCRKILEEI